VIEYFLAGASAVQLGTVNYQDPSAGEKMIDELETYCKDVSIDSISSLIGKVKN
jgi:dihydroorotate dehydrogenase (NAD+) catalytic subunit